MDPFTAASLGLQGVSLVSSLIGGNAAAKRAKEEARKRLLEWSKELSAEEDAIRQGGARSLASYAGDLNSALESGGRSLGEANAGAGVFNSTAVAGANTLAQQGNAAEISRFSSELADRLAQLRSRNRQSIAGMQVDQANQDYGVARGAQQGGMASLAQLAQMLPAFVNPQKTKSVNSVLSAANTASPNPTPFALPGINGLRNRPLYTPLPKFALSPIYGNMAWYGNKRG